MTATETVKCPACGFENEPAAKECAKISCNNFLKSEREALISIEMSLKTIKRIAIWWLVLSIAGSLIAAIYILSKF